MRVVAQATVNGSTAARFEPVAAVFAAIAGDGGVSAFSVRRGEERVVDLWSGPDGAAAPVLPAFSGTKALVAACVLLLVARGQLELDAPLRRWWPGFGRVAEPPVTLRHVLTHTSGLPGIRAARLRPDDLLDGEAMAALLARERPIWSPGTRFSYHPLTYGWLLDAVVRRADGRDLARFFDDEIARPRGLELALGLPSVDAARVPPLALAGAWTGAQSARIAAADPALFHAVYRNPDVWSPAGITWWQQPATRRAGLPGAGAFGTADAIASFFAALIRTDSGPSLLTAGALRGAVATEVAGRCLLTGAPYRYGIGFQLQRRDRPFGPAAVAFGHSGAGGSLHGAWPRRRIAFSFASSRLRDDADDRRASRLLAALARCERETRPPAADQPRPQRHSAAGRSG